MEVINALGRRKSAVARVYVNTGKGNITINGRTLEEYFKEDSLRFIVKQPLDVTGTLADFDIKANLDGGGIKGQAEALRLAISRALCEINKDAYRPVLKSNGFLTRDAREVERKKPGQRCTQTLPIQQTLVFLKLLIYKNAQSRSKTDGSKWLPYVCLAAKNLEDRLDRYFKINKENSLTRRQKQTKQCPELISKIYLMQVFTSVT